MHLQSASDGVLVLGFPTATAEALAARALAGVTEEVGPDMVRDCMGGGRQRHRRPGQGPPARYPYRFTFSTPTILTGADRAIDVPAGTDCLVIAFGSDAGNSTLQVCLKV